MLKKKEIILLKHFRQNARNSLTKISRMTNVPVSTIFDRLKEFEEQYITKHTAILDFQKLGFDLKAHIIIKVRNENKEELKKHLIKHKQINNIFRINNGYDFLIEAIFKQLKELDEFYQEIDRFGILDKKEYYILEDVVREAFMSNENPTILNCNEST